MTLMQRCPNMNHGRSNVMIKFCPNCGKTLNASVHATCNEQRHTLLRKSRFGFCHDCGKKLLK